MQKEMDIREVEKVIEELSILKNLNWYCKDNPFLPPEWELTELHENVTEMLNNYIYFLSMFDAGELLFNSDGAKVQANPASGRSGKNAPAYKKSIDNDLIYKLFLSGLSINKIAKQAHCSPDTVKRRIFDMQHRTKKG